MFGIHSTSYAGQLLSVPCNLPLLWISQDRSVRLPSLFITSTCVVDTTITLKQMLRHIEPSSLRKLHSYGYLILNASTFIVGSPKIIMGFDSMHSLTHNKILISLWFIKLKWILLFTRLLAHPKRSMMSVIYFLI